MGSMELTFDAERLGTLYKCTGHKNNSTSKCIKQCIVLLIENDNEAHLMNLSWPNYAKCEWNFGEEFFSDVDYGGCFEKIEEET
jgi:hypothetical protein